MTTRRSTLQKKIRAGEKFCKVVIWVAVILSSLVLIMSNYMASEWFAYTKEETYPKKETYTVVVERVDTYVCYTTTYGSCYHSRGCGSLWNSSYKTTVYEAIRDGYVKCSKCTPRVRTVYEVEETRERTVYKTRTVTKEPTLWVIVIGVGSIAILAGLLILAEKAEINTTTKNVLLYESIIKKAPAENLIEVKKLVDQIEDVSTSNDPNAHEKLLAINKKIGILCAHPQKGKPVTTDKEETYIYDTAANGMTARIPLSQYDNWRKAQDQIKNGTYVPDPKELAEKKAKLMELIYGNDTSKKEPDYNVESDWIVDINTGCPIRKDNTNV